MRLKKVLSLVMAISTMLVTSSYQIAFAESDFTEIPDVTPEFKISEELKEQIDELMQQYANEKIDGDTYAQKMMELTTSAQNDNN